MSYLERVLQPGERLEYQTRLHWIVYAPAWLTLLLALIAIIGFGLLGRDGVVFVGLATIAFMSGIITLIGQWIHRLTTEIAVTDRRVIYKRGLIRRHTIEMNMDKVESVDVNQSILGRILDYGTIIVRGTGSGIEPLRKITAPLEFRGFVTAR